MKLYWIAFKLSDRIWFTNKFDYQWFIDEKIINKQQSFLTKNYVNTDDYSQDIISLKEQIKLKKEFNLDSNDKIIVMVARMSWAKGVKEFVEAAQILRNKHNNVKFILIGPLDDGSTDSVPEAYLNKNQNYSNFIWTGFRKDVKAFYAISHLAVLPTYYREGGYPRGLTEAMAMGKPIIATDSVHCRGTIENGKNGYHVPIKSSEGLADAIEKIITDESKMKSFGIYSRQKALDEFDEKNIISQVISNIL
jgi:N,N'-diacetylbacillosaminyl-diphospho-undecaprenol alpha-1,3-N-acetylgalactosaminyltransferase